MKQKMRRLFIPGLCAGMLAGCIVREEPPRRRVVVVEEAPPPAPVEVVPVAPGPEFIYAPGVYVREGGIWRWHRGYWHRR